MDSKFAITISRQYGSGGLAVGKKLSADLRIPFYDKDLIALAAKKSGLVKEFIEISEEKPPFPGFLSALGNAIFSGYGSGYCENMSDSIFKIQSRVIKTLARKESSVFIGRCADYVLREHKNKLRVFICANLEDRINNISKQRSISKELALKEIEKNDRQRSRYYEYYTDVEMGNAKYYDLCINSSFFGIEKTADFIKDFALRKFKMV
jgi:cytidylate kinase